MIDQSIKKADICPVCNNNGSKNLFSSVSNQATYGIRQCMKCSLAWTVPLYDESKDIYDDKQYYGSGSNKFIPILQNIRSRLSRIRAKRYLSMIPNSVKQLKILDVGCAEGRLLKSFLEVGCDCYGIEHKSYPRERFLESDRITYYAGDIDTLELEPASFDMIIMWHVLEHVDSPDRVISIIHDFLKPDGIFILAVPNFSCTEAKIFRKHWFHLDIPWHKFHFTGRSLEYLLSKNRFKIVGKNYFCVEQGPFGLLQSILNWLGWPRNELYEAMKGGIFFQRILPLFTQSFIAILILVPCVFVSWLRSKMKEGAVFKLTLKKQRGNR